MDVAPILFWLHIGFAFAFVLAHGGSVFVSLRLRRERDPARLGALLDLSLSSVKVASLMLLLTILTGVIATFVGEAWGRGWVWAAIGILVFLWVWMSLRGVRWFDAVRHALGKEGFHEKAAKEGAPGADLEALLGSSRPMELTAVGIIGLALIIWLMFAKPF